MESHWKLPPTLGWPATVMHPRTKWTLNNSTKILRKCTTLKSAINFLRPCKLNSQIIYSVHYNKAEILTLGESGAVVAANNTERVSTVPKPVPTPDASSVGTGRAGGSVYPFPAFPLVLSPQRAKSISTYAPQQQFHNHHAPAYPRVVYSQRPSQGKIE